MRIVNSSAPYVVGVAGFLHTCRVGTIVHIVYCLTLHVAMIVTGVGTIGGYAVCTCRNWVGIRRVVFGGALVSSVGICWRLVLSERHGSGQLRRFVTAWCQHCRLSDVVRRVLTCTTPAAMFLFVMGLNPCDKTECRGRLNPVHLPL